MERSPQLPAVPSLTDFQSRNGLRESAMRIYDFIAVQRQKLQTLFSQVATELNFLYGELSYSAAAPANGTQALLTVAVSGAIPGYKVDTIFDQDLGGLIMNSYVSANDTVTILLRNETGGAVNLAGKFRCYVWPRILS